MGSLEDRVLLSSEELLGGPPCGAAPDTRWELLINISSWHCVTPALAWCLRDQADVPPDIRAYFDAVLDLNARRNEHLLGGLGRIVAALNANNIEPVLLKGAARLVDGSYPAPMLRFLGDLDLLIPTQEMANAAAALKDIGFATKTNDPTNFSHHHLPMLYDRDAGVGVELHKHPVPPPVDAIVSTSWFWEQTRQFQFRSLRVRLSEVTRAVAHNIVHDQCLHGQYRRKGVELRQLLDFALIRARHDGEIDWAEMDFRFCNAGKGQVLATYVDFANKLLGQPAPVLKCAPNLGAFESFERRTGLPTVRRLAGDYFAARCQEPLGVLRLFDPSTWVDRIRAIKSAFDTPL